MGEADAASALDDFEILRVLGAGGMGTVWEARDLRRGHKVALKRLNAHGVDDVARFKREARVLCALEHPNLVRVYELVEREADHFLSMELVVGVPLDEYCKFERTEEDLPRVERRMASHEGRLRQVLPQLAE